MTERPIKVGGTRRTARNPLNPRRLLLIALYLKDPTISMADLARQSGFTKTENHDSAGTIGRRIFNEPAVRMEIMRRQEANARRSNLSIEKIVDELAIIAHSDIGDFSPVLDSPQPIAALRALPSELTRAIKALRVRETTEGRTIELALWDKNDAVKTLGGHMGLRRSMGFYAQGEGMPGTVIDAGERMATLRSKLALLDERDIADLKRIAEKLERLSRPKLLEQTVTDEDDDEGGAK